MIQMSFSRDFNSYMYVGVIFLTHLQYFQVHVHFAN